MRTTIRPLGCLALAFTLLLSTNIRAADEDDEKSTLAALKDKAVEATKKKVAETMEDLKAAAVVTKEAGFKMSEVRIEIGFLPSIEVEFDVQGKISDEKKVEMLKEHEDKKILSGVLKALFAAQSMDVNGYKLQRVKMKVSLAPKTTLIFAVTD